MAITKENINTDNLKQAETFLRSHILKYVDSMSLKCAVELGIPTAIHNHGKPITINELTSSLSISPAKKLHINRLMRMLCHSGIFMQVQSTESDEDAYSLTPISNLLVDTNNLNLSKLLLVLLHPFLIDPFHSMSTWFKRDCESAPFSTLSGLDFWAMTCKDENFNKVFNEGMASDSKFLMDVLLREHGNIFDGIKSLVDVGGGTGSVAKAISKAFPDIGCTVLERPVVVASAVNNEENRGVEFVAGDMFVHIPPADAIFLKLILHDWNDEECVKILKQCKESVLSNGKRGKVIIIDHVVGTNESDEKSIDVQLYYDMLMMTLCGSAERDEQEWKKIFMDAGFKHYQITPVLGTSVIEVYP